MDLSIIVPIYNVEQYVRACIESIYRQGLDEDRFVVILVNDGTKDKSMEVIADIIQQHKNITVVHQENQGLSMARNNGMAIAKGEYILMPDSDDLLVENSVKPLLEKALETKADMIVADFLKFEDTELDLRHNEIPQKTNLVFIKKENEELYLDDLDNNECYVWRTIYRREFLIKNNLTFYPGITFEDIAFTHKCYLNNIISFRVHWLLYGYRIRQNSISCKNTFSVQKAHDLCIAIAQTRNLIKEKDFNSLVIKKLNNDLYLSYHNLLCRTLYGRKAYKDKIHIIKILKTTVPDLKFNNGIKQKFHTLLLKTSPQICIIVWTIIKHIHWSHNNKHV